MITHRAVIERFEKSLQVFASSEEGIKDQVSKWLEAKVVKKGEVIKVYEITEKLIAEIPDNHPSVLPSEDVKC